MSTAILISGRIFRNPERRECRTGATFATATVKVVDGGTVSWWSVVAFGTVAESLLLIDEGDAVAVSGKLETSIYQMSSGEQRVGLKVIAEQVVALKSHPAAAPASPRHRAPAKRMATPKTPAKVTRPAIDADLNDPIPF